MDRWEVGYYNIGGCSTLRYLSEDIYIKNSSLLNILNLLSMLRFLERILDKAVRSSILIVI